MTRYDQTIVRKRSRILYVDNNTLYAQIGNKLCASDDSGLTWRTYPLSLVGGACNYSRLHARVTRRGVHCAKVLSDGNCPGCRLRLQRDNGVKETTESKRQRGQRDNGVKETTGSKRQRGQRDNEVRETTGSGRKRPAKK